MVNWCYPLVVKTQTYKAHLSALAGTRRLAPNQQRREVVLVPEVVAFALNQCC